MMDYVRGVETGRWYIDASMTPKELRDTVHNYYKNIVLIESKSDRDLLKKNYIEPTFFIRGDILPVSNKEIIRIMQHSVRDILITGDQSITDVLSCCPDKKNIWYQITPWKKNLGYNLAKKLPNEFLKTKKTSCGTLKGLDYKANYNEFVKENNFKVNFKPIMDAILSMIKSKKPRVRSRRRSRK
jgi:hypothetical protein